MMGCELERLEGDELGFSVKEALPPGDRLMIRYTRGWAVRVVLLYVPLHVPLHIRRGQNEISFHLYCSLVLCFLSNFGERLWILAGQSGAASPAIGCGDLQSELSFFWQPGGRHFKRNAIRNFH